MKKQIMAAFALASLSSFAYAQHSVIFNINGQILPRTCELQTTGDKTITMVDKYIDEFTDTELYGDATDFAHIRCPIATRIEVSIDDNNNSQAGLDYLRNNAAASEAAANVGVSIVIRANASTTGGLKMKTGEKQIFRSGNANNAANYMNMGNYNIYVHPHYYKINNNITPGKVEASMTLNITYP